MTPTGYILPTTITNINFFELKEDIILESGEILESPTIAYHTYGKLNDARDNVIWVCHALTANSNVEDWWSGLFGGGKVLDPSKYFIVCANMIGSNYGSTCARSLNPKTGQPYGLDFPLITIKDIANAHFLLAQHLNINAIELALGGSCGGHQVLEMCLINTVKISKAIVLVTSAKETAWSIAIHEAQRLALKADTTFSENNIDSGKNGLMAARGMSLIGYRTFDQYRLSQSDNDFRVKNFKASSYIEYQGHKLVNRFHAHCYYHLLNSLDSHNIGRGRTSIENALGMISQKILVISIDSDVLIPKSEQDIIVKGVPHATHAVIESSYGHDGFLIETARITNEIEKFLDSIN